MQGYPEREFKLMGGVSMLAGNCPPLPAEVQRRCRTASDSDSHPKLAKGQAVLKVRCYVPVLVSLFFPSCLFSWLRRPKLDVCVHLTRRPSQISFQIYQRVGMIVSRCTQRTRRFSGGRLSRLTSISSLSWACSVCL